MAAVAACLAVAGPVAAGTGAYGVTSDNVTHVRNIAKHADSSGARLKDGYFYITTGRDLSIYDVSTPEDPQEVGTLLLPEVAEPAFAEEDVDTNGRILLVENQGTLFVIDVTDKTNPVVKSELTDAGVHTITCVLDCSYAYGENGKIFDLRDTSNPKLLAKRWTDLLPDVESFHDVTEVSPGMILTASQPISLIDARIDPANPTLAKRAPLEADRFVHATRWPRGGDRRLPDDRRRGDRASVRRQRQRHLLHLEREDVQGDRRVPRSDRHPRRGPGAGLQLLHPLVPGAPQLRQRRADGDLLVRARHEVPEGQLGRPDHRGRLLPAHGRAGVGRLLDHRSRGVRGRLPARARRAALRGRHQRREARARPRTRHRPRPPGKPAARKADPRRDVRRYLSIASNRRCVRPPRPAGLPAVQAAASA